MTLQQRLPGRSMLVGAVLALLIAQPGGASELFRQPSIGFVPPPVVRTVPPSVAPSLNANQCLLSAGSCPLGRLQRSGGRCFCATTGGATRQGTTRTRPQDARPPVAPQQAR